MTIEVDTRSRRVLDWVSSHLHSDIASVTDTVERISVVVDPVRLGEARRAAGEAPHQRVEGYRGEWWGRWDGADATTWRHDDDVLVQRPLRLPTWEVLARHDTAAATAALRVARELVRMRLRELGSFTVHGALVGTPRGGVLVVGASGSGKTTLALHLARRGGTFVSGDQSMLLDGVVGVGFPLVLRLGYGTLVSLGVPDVLEPPPIRPQPAVVAGSVVPAARHFRSQVKVELTMAEVACAADVRVASTTPVTAVVVLRDATGQGPPEVRPVTPEQVAQRIRPELREPNPTFVGYWLDRGDRPALRAPGPHPDRFFDLTRTLPFFEVAWHPAVHGVDPVLSRLARHVDC